MKNQKTETQATPLTFDSQSRLLAYTTAAGLGAFLADQGGEAQVVESAALAPYPLRCPKVRVPDTIRLTTIWMSMATARTILT
jgi:hypothetical protein